ncbi:MAG TPA: DUF2071 domain-containing protein [Citricoccus sp.]
MSGRFPDHPVRVPVGLQSWEHVTFLHWPYPAAAVQRLVPGGLTVQHWEGLTWVGITPFRMVGARAPGVPPPSGWAAFPELNVRAYVRARDGQDGIWFLGMVASRRSFVIALRSLGLPYEPSRASVSIGGSRWTYRFGTPYGFGSGLAGWFEAVVDVGGPLGPRELTPVVESLTGRWSAYHRRAGMLWRTPVVHEPWPLHAATVTGSLEAPLRWAGLPAPTGDPLVHAAPAVHARLGVPRRA